MAAPSPPSPLFLAQKRSVPALFQKLLDENHLTLPSFDIDRGQEFVIKRGDVLLPNPNFMHQKQYKIIIAKKAQLAAVPTATPQTQHFVPVVGEYVPIEFDTLALIWYMLRCHEALDSVDAAVAFLGIRLTEEAYDVFDEFDLPRHSEDECMSVTIDVLFSIVLNAFFIERRPLRFINLLLVNARSPILGEYEDAKGEPLLVDKHCFTHQEQPYLMTLYGTFVTEYMQTFMAHYGNVWSINKGRHV